jgi:hypothetical protein
VQARRPRTRCWQMHSDAIPTSIIGSAFAFAECNAAMRVACTQARRGCSDGCACAGSHVTAGSTSRLHVIAQVQLREKPGKQDTEITSQNTASFVGLAHCMQTLMYLLLCGTLHELASKHILGEVSCVLAYPHANQAVWHSWQARQVATR